jgi:hypothetical protein
LSSNLNNLNFTKSVLSILLLGCIAGPATAHANEERSGETWAQFKVEVDARTDQQKVEGIAYMVSGGLVLIGSAIGYEKSTDPIAKSVYSISQSLSIGAMGYGSYLYSIGDGDRDFLNIIENSTSLTIEQKNEILRNYRARHEHNRKHERVIRIATHGLIAVLNIYNATREENEGLRTALYFVGGVNAIAAFSVTF